MSKKTLARLINRTGNVLTIDDLRSIYEDLKFLDRKIYKAVINQVDTDPHSVEVIQSNLEFPLTYTLVGGGVTRISTPGGFPKGKTHVTFSCGNNNVAVTILPKAYEFDGDVYIEMLKFDVDEAVIVADHDGEIYNGSLTIEFTP